MMRALVALRRALPDLLGLSGAIAIVVGLAQLSHAAAWIVAGLLALCLAVLLARGERPA